MNTATANEAMLSEYDFVVCIDASGSMGTEDMKGRSRWKYMQESAEAFARDLAKFDSDGLGLVVFSGTSVESFDGIGVDKIHEVFTGRQPRGSTPMAEALEAALKLAGKSAKKDFIIVFTDGTPDDPNRVASVIKQAAAKQDTDDALTILFVQVGYDRDASKYLRDLDDHLTGAKFDIVDAKTIEEAEKFSSTADLVIAAIAD